MTQSPRIAFTDLFSDHADFYARARPHYPAALFEYITAQSPGLDRAWDCGTGNGQAALGLAASFRTVLASDPSRKQIAQAAPAANICYSVQSAEHTDFPAGYFDAICVAQALHWFDFTPFFAEVQRVARPGALFMAWGYSWPLVSTRFDAELDAAVYAVIAPYWAPQNRWLWDGYVHVPFPLIRLTPPTFAIRELWTFGQFFAYLNTWSAVRSGIKQLGPGFMHAAAPRLVAAWGAPDAQREVLMPLHVLAGRVSEPRTKDNNPPRTIS